MELANKPSAHEQEERTPAQPSISMEEAKDQKHSTASARQLEPVPRKIPLDWLPVHPYYQVMDPGLLVLRCQHNRYPTTLTGLAGILGLRGDCCEQGRFRHCISEWTSAYIGIYLPASPRRFISQIDAIPSVDMIYVCCAGFYRWFMIHNNYLSASFIDSPISTINFHRVYLPVLPPSATKCQSPSVAW